MRKNILITGIPHSGKSVILKTIVARFENKVGFVTNEIRPHQDREGFMIETYNGEQYILAHVSFDEPPRVSKYGVRQNAVSIAVNTVSDFTNASILYLDEIGEMQLFSPEFPELVRAFFDSDKTCIATISQVFDHPFIDEIRNRDDVFLIEISENSLASNTEAFILKLISKIDKARKYVKDHSRFSQSGDDVHFASDSGVRTLVLKDEKWECCCNFHRKYQICSHSIATEVFMKSVEV